VKEKVGDNVTTLSEGTVIDYLQRCPVFYRSWMNEVTFHTQLCLVVMSWAEIKLQKCWSQAKYAHNMGIGSRQ
jgi:hypothetical protein